MEQHIDWIKVGLGALALAWTIAGPWVIKRNARLAKILSALVQGVEEADHGPTKAAIENAAEEKGVLKALDKVVQAETKP